jgi:hypothetical protein
VNDIEELQREVAEEEAAQITLPPVRPWIDIRAAKSDAVLIGPGRFLCPGAGVFVIAPSGAGKSTWSATQAFWWAIGRESLGLEPTRPLKSLIFQAEDDDGDLEEMASGVMGAMNCSQEEQAVIRANVLMVTERAATGLRFLREVVAPVLAEVKPDLLWVNPLSAYFGDDLNDQRAVAAFFRNTLNPLLAEYHCLNFTIHHVPKPNKERDGWTGTALSYAGAGSADLSNWAREVIVLKETSPGLFEMTATKRWRKLGWTDAEGKPTPSRLIAHGVNGQQVWRDATREVLADLGAVPYSNTELLALVPDGGMDKAELLRQVAEKFSVTTRTAANYVAGAIRPCNRTVNGKRIRGCLLESQERLRREIYPDSPSGRPVVWLTKVSADETADEALMKGSNSSLAPTLPLAGALMKHPLKGCISATQPNGEGRKS